MMQMETLSPQHTMKRTEKIRSRMIRMEIKQAKQMKKTTKSLTRIMKMIN